MRSRSYLTRPSKNISAYTRFLERCITRTEDLISSLEKMLGYWWSMTLCIETPQVCRRTRPPSSSGSTKAKRWIGESSPAKESVRRWNPFNQVSGFYPCWPIISPYCTHLPRLLLDEPSPLRYHHQGSNERRPWPWPGRMGKHHTRLPSFGRPESYSHLCITSTENTEATGVARDPCRMGWYSWSHNWGCHHTAENPKDIDSLTI